MKRKANRPKWRSGLYEFAVLTFAMLIVAGAVFFFLMPSHAAVSSVAGAAIVLSNLIPLPVSVITLFINLALLLAGFLTFGREFGIKTVYTGILLSVLLGIFENLLPNYQSITGSPELDVICYVLVVSAGLVILFRMNASSGGLDIVAQILNKLFRVNIGTAMTIAMMCIAVSSALVYDTRTVVLSILGTYLNGIVLDHFIFGQNLKRRVCIITPKSEQLLDYVLHTLHSGATIYHSTGAYSHAQLQEIIVIVDRAEYQKLMAYMKHLDPDAFITVYTVSELHCRPKAVEIPPSM